MNNVSARRRHANKAEAGLIAWAIRQGDAERADARPTRYLTRAALNAQCGFWTFGDTVADKVARAVARLRAVE